MKTSISLILLTVALVCVYPVNSEFSLFLRGRTEETPVETTIEAKEPEDVRVSRNQIDSLHCVIY